MLTYLFLILLALVTAIAIVFYAMLKLQAWGQNRTLRDCYVFPDHFFSFWLSNHGLTPEFLESIEAVCDGSAVFCTAEYIGFNSYCVKINTYTLTLSVSYLLDWKQDMVIVFNNHLYPNIV